MATFSISQDFTHARADIALGVYEFVPQLAEELRQSASEGLRSMRMVVQPATAQRATPRKGQHLGEALCEHFSGADLISVARCTGDAELDQFLQGRSADR